MNILNLIKQIDLLNMKNCIKTVNIVKLRYH